MANATDELRRMLDERGVEWSASSDEIEHVTVTRWLSGGNSIAYVELNDGFVGYEARLIISGLSITPEQAIAATLGRSTLTAHDVWEAIGNHGVSQLQAIADELNAKLCGGECEMDAHGNCTACGEFVAKSLKYVHTFDGGYEAKPCRAHNYCPNCGKMIRKAVKR